jgi:hypothetical protein
MRRGFKKEAREIAAGVRAELGLTPFQPLDPWALAAHLDIPVWALSSYTDSIPAASQHILHADTAAFSAMLAFLGRRRVVVYNDAHAVVRQSADISHELAHALLVHVPQATRDGLGREFDAEQEDEAKWLGGVLLVTDDFCVSCAVGGVNLADAAAAMCVSTQLMQWRFNMSGAIRRLRRRQAA